MVKVYINLRLMSIRFFKFFFKCIKMGGNMAERLMGFAKKLKTLRELADMSQKELSERIGISTVMISQYENGKKMPARTTLNKIAEVFGVTTSDLLGEDPGDETSEEMIIINRAAKKMTPEKRRQLLEIAKSIFKEEFNE